MWIMENMAHKKEIKELVITLRKSGKTYSEIRGIIHCNIPKSTLSSWFNTMYFDEAVRRKIYSHSQMKIQAGSAKSAAIKRCYSIDEGKLRCTVQCRADQDVDALECFWAK